MKRIFISALMSLVLVSGVAAQTVPGTREGVKPAAQNLRESIKNAQENFKQDVREVKGVYAQKREELKEEFKVKREEAKERFEREREVLKARLEKVRDEKKKQSVERIAGQVKGLNDKTLNQLSDKLDKVEKVLDRIVGRADKAEGRGLDVSSVRAAVSLAETAISAARAAITAQAGKVYSVVMATSTEGTLKRDVGGIRKMLHDDLSKVRDAVKVAHDTVRNAATTLAKTPRVDEEKATSTSGTATSTL